MQSLVPTPQSDDFITKYGNRPWAAAGTAAKAGVGELKNGALLVMKGDTMGGTAAILSGIGSVSGLMSLAGPVGAIIAGVMAIFTAIISAVLDALKPATRSLEDKIKGMLTDETLKVDRDILYGAYESWATIQVELSSLVQAREQAAKSIQNDLTQTDPNKKLSATALAEQIKIAGGMSWTKLTNYSGWRDHQKTIFTTFSALSSRKGQHSKEWMPLYDLTIQYALNFWVGFTSMAALVDHNGAETYRVARETLAKQLRDELYGSHFASLNEGALWAIYYSGPPSFESAGYSPYILAAHNNLYQFSGVFGEGAVLTQENLGGQVVSFAVSSGGTIFSVGKIDGYRLCAGRGKADDSPGWRIEPNKRLSDQVFIGERHDGIIKVISLHTNGHNFTVFDYDDGIGKSYENNPTAWTPNDRRWLSHKTYGIPDGKTILSLAVDPRSLIYGEPLAFYAFALDESGGGNCYRYTLDETKGYIADAQIFHETWMTHEQIRVETFDVGPRANRSQISPCTVSCTGNGIFAQVGNMAWVFERSGDHTWRKWNLPNYFDDSSLTFHQAYGGDDGAFVCITNKGLRMRYWNVETKQPAFAREDKIQTVRFVRQASRQADVMLELLASMESVVTQAANAQAVEALA
ncbi:hypothetical protein [Granulicella sp. S156]|uniref:hypothetical protein n=1 Tax=Granulicella sp. S156 TaxID=1747224 RepID=UPI00131DECC6|nr:hypothetical protein [Granulicella sp. S156]